MHFLASNNAAEYEAWLHGLRIAMVLEIHRLRVLGDSLLVINQANKDWSCLDDEMIMYCHGPHKLENNLVADEPAKLGSSLAVVPLGIFMEELHEPSISTALYKANKVVESSQETMSPTEGLSQSPNVMAVHLD
jgi:hypothetical protein